MEHTHFDFKEVIRSSCVKTRIACSTLSNSMILPDSLSISQPDVFFGVGRSRHSTKPWSRLFFKSSLFLPGTMYSYMPGRYPLVPPFNLHCSNLIKSCSSVDMVRHDKGEIFFAMEETKSFKLSASSNGRGVSSHPDFHPGSSVHFEKFNNCMVLHCANPTLSNARSIPPLLRIVHVSMFVEVQGAFLLLLLLSFSCFANSTKERSKVDAKP
mmetsp:Transcript_28132/g.53112  ORF Transcript_28132/g.53112 Transcript_28132/m.53112 type:complete len:212 (-) Transcript_28132:137-772(-)